MASVRSSSAMTFNLLGNDSVTINKKFEQIEPGIYKVNFEKQMYTLGCEGNPANLDAFLEGQKQAVFCEMKMTEWLFTTHGELADKYEMEENYFSKKAYAIDIGFIPTKDFIECMEKQWRKESIWNVIGRCRRCKIDQRRTV